MGRRVFRGALCALVATAAVALVPTRASAAGGDFKTIDFAAAAPFTYTHQTGGGAYNDRTVGDYKDVTEQLEGAQFVCGDIVTYLAQLEIEAAPVDANQTAELNFRFLGNSTGQAGAAHAEVVGVRINYGMVENGDNGTGVNPGVAAYGLDSGCGDDRGSTATLLTQSLSRPLFENGSELLATVHVDDLEAGEKVVVRIDTRLACKPGTSPTGNLQGQLDSARLVAVGGVPLANPETIGSGQQTIPFLRVGDIFGAGEGLLQVSKSVVQWDARCSDGGQEQITVEFGGAVRYCYLLTNPGTYPTYDISIRDDNATPGDPSDDFMVTIEGLTNIDGQGDLGDLAAGATAVGSALRVPMSTGTVTNMAHASGNNGLRGGSAQVLTAEDTATVIVTAVSNREPVANPDVLSIPEDASGTVSVATNDTDPDGNLDLGSITIATDPLHGTLEDLGNGVFVYTPAADYTGEDSFDYEICDTAGLCVTGTVTVYVATVNDPPFAEADYAAGLEDMPIVVNVAGNDYDPDGELDLQSVVWVTEPANGTLVANGDGTFTYTPRADFFGSDSFSYQICDDGGLCVTALAAIDVAPVNDPPLAENDWVETSEDEFVVIVVAENDSDVDGNLAPTTVVTVTLPTNGTILNNADGTMVYTPFKDYYGPDQFIYRICDTEFLCATAVVDIVVNPVNDPPYAIDDFAQTDEDASVEIDVLLNDSDVDGDVLAGTVFLFGPPEHGTATYNEDGVFLYVPEANYFGRDVFLYTLCDEGYLCTTATVTVLIASINDAPVAADDAVTVEEDGRIVIPATDNDSDIDGNLAAATAALASPPLHGTVTANGDGTFLYVPYPNYYGSDSFTYTVCDAESVCATATVTITVTPVNDRPTATDDMYTAYQDTPLTVTAPTVLANDSDIDGDPLSVAAFDATSAFGGTVNVAPGGTFTFTPRAGFCGYDSFTYTVSDGNGGTALATVVITVEAVNNRSIAVTLSDFTLLNRIGLTGRFDIANHSGAYDVQIIDANIEVQHKLSSARTWNFAALVPGSCSFMPAPLFVVNTTASVGFRDCRLLTQIPANSTVRVTVNVRIFGRIKGAKDGGWYLSRLSKEY